MFYRSCLLTLICCSFCFGSDSSETIDLKKIKSVTLKELTNFSATPQPGKPLGMYRLDLPEYELGVMWVDALLGKAGNRVNPIFFTSDNCIPQTTKSALKSRHVGQCMLLKLKNGQFMAVLPIANAQAQSSLAVGEDNQLYIKFESMGNKPLSGDFPLFSAAISASAYDAWSQVWTKAFEKASYGRLRGDKDYLEAFTYLGWCSWECYKGSITEEKILDAIASFKQQKVPVRWVLLDDGHSKKHSGVSPNEKFPNAYDRIRAAADGDPVKWIGLWYSSLGVQSKNGLMAPADLGDYLGDMYSQLGTYWNITPKPTQDSNTQYWDYLYERGAKDADFIKVDFIKDMLNIYSKIAAEEKTDLVDMPFNAVEASVFYKKAMEEATKGALMNCNGNNFPNPFFAKYSNSTRCSLDYKKNSMASAILHIYLSYHNAVSLGHVYWTDHDMFHSNDDFAGQIMAVTKALSGGPVYISDIPDHLDINNITPLCYDDGKLLRPIAPAVPSEDTLFSAGNGIYKAFAPINKHAVAVHIMNLSKKEGVSVAGTITRHDFRDADAMVQPYPGLRTFSKEGVFAYDVLGHTGQILTDKGIPVALSTTLDHKLYQLSTIANGWSFIGRTDKYLSAAAGTVTKQEPGVLEVTLEEAGPFAVYCSRGTPQAKGLKFVSLGKDLYQADMPIGSQEKIRITVK